MSRGVCMSKGVCVSRGCVYPGVYVSRGGGVSMGTGCVSKGAVHPPVDRMTNTCENITFLQLLLWMVISLYSSECGL